MNRLTYFNNIVTNFNQLACDLRTKGKLNLLDHHLHSEDFYMHFCNMLYGWELENLNIKQHNAEGIDLVDNKNKIIASVSATATKQKIQASLNKDLSAYKDYSFKFISVSEDTKKLRSQKYQNKHGLAFSPTNDILDIPSFLHDIKGLNIDQIKNVYDFLNKELENKPAPEKIESNLATIIDILSKEDWTHISSSFETIPYDIENKISFNQLETVKDIIDDFKIYYSRIAEIYSEFDAYGVNKSLSILNGIRTEYINLCLSLSPDQRFLSTIYKIMQRIQNSANYTPIPREELELTVQILVVDAFIRCKIFKNPLENTNACP